MLKKSIFTLLAILLLFTSSVGVALAEEGSAIDRHGNKDKKAVPVLVLSVGEDQFTIQGKNGKVNILVSEATVYKNREGDDLSLSNLIVGDYVVLKGQRDVEGNVVARYVFLMPEDFNPEEVDLIRMKGKVVSVQILQRSFDLLLDSGKTVRIKIDGNTRFAGAVNKLSDLKPEMIVGVAALRKDDGTILAKAVIARRSSEDRPDAKRVSGKVISVGNHSLSIETRDGRLNFILNDATVIKGPLGRDINLNDLENGMVVTVAYKTNADGKFLALHVLVNHTREDRPQLRRFSGEVRSINRDEISIHNEDGKTLSFEINNQTRFVSRDGAVIQASDIQVGQKVLVVFLSSEEGNLVAKIIGVGKTSDN